MERETFSFWLFAEGEVKEGFLMQWLSVMCDYLGILGGKKTFEGERKELVLVVVLFEGGRAV